jgi:hypothetical protein
MLHGRSLPSVMETLRQDGPQYRLRHLVEWILQVLHTGDSALQLSLRGYGLRRSLLKIYIHFCSHFYGHKAQGEIIASTWQLQSTFHLESTTSSGGGGGGSRRRCFGQSGIDPADVRMQCVPPARTATLLKVMAIVTNDDDDNVNALARRRHNGDADSARKGMGKPAAASAHSIEAGGHTRWLVGGVEAMYALKRDEAIGMREVAHLR